MTESSVRDFIFEQPLNQLTSALIQDNILPPKPEKIAAPEIAMMSQIHI
jgi:hypothetical protein